MKGFLLFFLAASSTAFQQDNLAKRDFQAITGVLTNISAELTNLHDTITNFTAGADPGPFERAQDSVVAAIQNGIPIVQQSANLTNDESVMLSEQVAKTADLSNSTVQAAKDKKDVMVAAGLGPVVYAGMENAYIATLAIAQAIVNKVPPGAQLGAITLQDRFITTQVDGLNFYSDQAGSDATVPMTPSGTVLPTVSFTAPLPSIATAFTSLSSSSSGSGAAPTDPAGYGAAIFAAAAAAAAAVAAL